MTTYVIVTGKGGEGKTFIASAIAEVEALRGDSTVYIEIDNSTRAYLTLIPPEVRGKSLADAKTAYAFLRDPGSPLDARNIVPDATYTINLEDQFARGVGTQQEIRDAHYEHRWTCPVPVDMIPGTPRLRFADNELYALSKDPTATINPLLVFRDRLAFIKARYKHVIIDMPPNLEFVFAAILAAADEIIIPVSLDPASVYEFEQTYAKYREVYSELKRLNQPVPHLAGVVVNRYNQGLAPHQKRLADYQAGALKVPVLGVIPLDVDTTSLAMEAAQTVITFAPASEVSRAVIRVVAALPGGHAQ